MSDEISSANYGIKIAEAREAKGWSQTVLGEKIGTSQQQIARYESGTDVKASTLVKLSKALDVTITYLLGLSGSVAQDAGPSKMVPVPVVARIAAGTPNEVIAQSDVYHDTQEEYTIEHPGCIWFTVAGNSMNRILVDGSLVLIAVDEEVRNGDIAAVFVNGYDATLKRVYFEKDGSIRLHPESYDPEYRDIVIDESNPDAPYFRIIGKAITYTAPRNWRP